MSPRERAAAEPSAHRAVKLAAIGTMAGVFSGLFGVGGGSVIVPLLMLWLAYEEREATATSLAAIVFIATFAAAVQGAYGNVKVLDALEIGLPAILGVLIGTRLQQLLEGRTIALLFALVLVGSAVELVLR